MRKNYTYYMDESGNTGDLVRTGGDLIFGGQPLFSLACIGVEDKNKVSVFIEGLAKKHKIKAKELKSTAIFKRKPLFILDLCKYITSEELPFFIEVVDKKYFICSNMVNSFVLPPYFSENTNEKADFLARNMIASYMTEKMPIECYQAFFDACITSTEKSLMEGMNALRNFFLNVTDDSGMKEVFRSVDETIDDYFHMKKIDNDESSTLKRFIPIPDKSKRDSDVWLLPHVSSLASIIARVNLFSSGNLQESKFIHDEQVHFDDILMNIKDQLFGLEFDKLFSIIETANYDIKENPKLDFEGSEDYIGVQLADLMAGFTTRYFKGLLSRGSSLDDVHHQIYKELGNSFNRSNGVGMNMVLSDLDLARTPLQVSHNF